MRIDGDWERWLDFFLRGVQEVASNAAVTARKILALREKYRELLGKQGRPSGALMLALDYLFSRPIVTPQSLAKHIGVTFVTASNAAVRLADLGVLREVTGYKRNRRFEFSPYLALFEDASRSAPSPEPAPDDKGDPTT